MAKWEHRGGGRFDVYERKSDWGGIVAVAVVVIILLAALGG
jgi:hypothetical protein